MTLTTHVAWHPDLLVDELCDRLAAAPEDPFTAEVVAVPTRGIERWLTQRIALGLAERGAGDGICAHVEFPSPRELIRRVLGRTPGMADVVAAWDGPDLIGHVLGVLDDHLDEPWLETLRRYAASGSPGADTPGPNRYDAARKIAALFTRYGARRPGMIRRWAGGADTGPAGDALTRDRMWQPRLWRLVRERIGTPSLAEALSAGLEPIRAGTVDTGLPGRVSVYGLTAVDPLDLEVLQAVAAVRDVHLHLLHPSPVLWAGTVEPLRDLSFDAAPPRRADPTAALAIHPLLRSWARDSRELQVVLAARGITSGADPGARDDRTAGILGRLQSDIRLNREPAAEPALRDAVSEGSDRSIQVHVCHGPRRQVEVLRDAILHLLTADPTLEARDVVIMTPDLAAFAPLLEAAFPTGERTPDADGVPDLRLRIADRAPAAVNPLVRFTATVLDLAGSRLEAAAVRDLVARPVVRQRFGYDDDTAGSIVSVIDDARVAWGLDAGHRTEWGAGGIPDRTWQRGLDRALTGVFYEDSLVRVAGEDTVPLDGIEGQEATPVGLLAQIVDRVAAVRDLMARPRPIPEWGPLIADAVRLLAAPAWGDEWQWNHLERLLAETFPPTGGEARPGPAIGRAEARRAVAAWTEDRPSPLHFRTGDITVCTLVPMRSVPYRVVCLLGMDDERFPRSSRIDGDDLLLDHEIAGDRDRAAEDRQLLLDALMAAGDHVIVVYSGRDELTNAPLPPAVPVAELTEVVGEMIGPALVEGRIVTTHPLQSFSAANFTPGALGVDGPWGFDPMQLDGAQATRDRRDRPVPTPAAWPEPEMRDPVRLDDLIRFVQHPIGYFARNRLGLWIPETAEAADDTLPADIGGLEAWALKDRILSGIIAGHDPDRLVARELHSDALPPGSLGVDDIEAAVETADLLWNAARERGFDPSRHEPRSGTVAIDGRSIEGSVEVDPDQGHLALVTPSRLKARQRIRAYAELVFATALDPSRPWTALLVGRRPKRTGHVAVHIGPLTRDATEREADALRRLRALVDLHDEGLRHPLPLPCETGHAWQRKAGSDRDTAAARAREEWEEDRYSPEAADPLHRMLLPGLVTVPDLLRAGFEDYCRRLWGPVVPLIVEKSA